MKINLDSNSVTYIYVAGRNKLQNDLLISFLKETTGFNVKYIKKLESAARVQQKEHPLTQLFLLDWTSVDRENIWSDINSFRSNNSCRSFFAFCNVDHKVAIEKLALTNNIQGLFYKDDPLQIIPRGIISILNGDLWFSRKTLSKCIREKSLPNIYTDHPATNNLTLREKEILILIASGDSNKGIASKLCIRFHTVKTHVYNIYNKINVDNRLQAVLWAVKNL